MSHQCPCADLRFCALGHQWHSAHVDHHGREPDEETEPFCPVKGCGRTGWRSLEDARVMEPKSPC